MTHIGGIIHPTSFQMNELITSMQAACTDKTPFFFRHKNIELVLFEKEISKVEGLVVMLDGEISNAEQLKMRLDVQVKNTLDLIAHAFLKWGENFVKEIEGTFVIALFDVKKEMLYLYRDQIGKKTLYWSQQGDYFLFSSEIKGLLATGVVPQTPSLSGLSSYLYFGYIPQELSAVLDVNKLLPGYYLKTDLARRYSIGQYWSLSAWMENKKHIYPAHDQIHERIEEDVESVLSDLVSIVWKLDEPIADHSTLLVWKKNQGEGSLLDNHERGVYHSIPLWLAKLPFFVRKYMLFPFFPHLKWRILRNIEINEELMRDLSAHALFKGWERKWISPRLFPHFDPEIFIERFHRLPKKSEDMLFYFYAKTKLPDSVLFQYEKLGSLASKNKDDLLKTSLPILADDVIEEWCNSSYIRELFQLLEEGVLVQQEIISPKWIGHQLGYPHLVPRVFKKMWSILILEIWFRLYITEPIGKASLALMPDELLRM